jgi:hypothetical protein
MARANSFFLMFFSVILISQPIQSLAIFLKIMGINQARKRVAQKIITKTKYLRMLMLSKCINPGKNNIGSPIWCVELITFPFRLEPPSGSKG